MSSYTGGWLEDTTVVGTRALIGDAGLYNGPWPPAPPPRENLPLTAGEVDYIVTAPSPDGDITKLMDGSYPTNYSWVGRYWFDTLTGQTQVFDNGISNSGGSAGTAMTPGAHLYVVWYDPDFDAVPGIVQPPVAVLDEAPAEWVTGGRGWTPASHWSGWQDGWIGTFVGAGAQEFHAVAREISRTDPAAFDVGAFVDAARATINGGGGTSIDGHISALLDHFMEVNSTLFNARLRLGYVAARYEATAASDFPTGSPHLPADAASQVPLSAFDDPVYGLYTHGAVQYEAPLHADFQHWTNDATTVITETYRETQTNTASLTNPMLSSTPPDITFSWLPTLAADTWLAYPAGAVLDDRSAPINGTLGVTTNHAYGLGSGAMPMDSVDDASFWLVAQSSFIDPATPLPYGGNDGSDTSWTSGFYNGGIARVGGEGPFFTPGPAAVWLTSRWRYWVEAATPPPGIDPPLRMQHRDDGLGPVSAHARLNVASFAPGQPSSTQLGRAPRVGTRNRYS